MLVAGVSLCKSCSCRAGDPVDTDFSGKDFVRLGDGLSSSQARLHAFRNILITLELG